MMSGDRSPSPGPAGWADTRLALLRALGPDGPDRDGAVAALAWADAAWLLDTAARGRLLLILNRHAPDGLRDAAPQVAAARRAAHTFSLANQSVLRRIAPAFADAKIRFVVLKGPLQQEIIHGSREIATATDVDILVAEADYDRAADVLVRQGFSVPRQCRAAWWRRHLGEQPFVMGERGVLPVDLHHKLQQPGCPAPRDLGYFLDDAVPMAVGTIAVPALKLRQACLLAGISFAKAIWHREPAARYAYDAAIMAGAMDAAARESLFAVAARQGLLATMRLALRGAALIAPELGALLAGERAPPLPEIDDATLAAFMLTPWDPTLIWPRRRRLLWSLCDGDSTAARLATYLTEQARLLASETSRMMAPKPARAAPPDQK